MSVESVFSPVVEAGIRHDDLPVIERLRETVRSWNTYEVSRSAPVAEISQGCEQGLRVRRLCHHLGIDMSQVMAIGDSKPGADQAAGPGVAMPTPN